MIAILIFLLLTVITPISHAATVEEFGVKITKEVDPVDLCRGNIFTVTVKIQPTVKADAVSGDVMLVLDRSLSMTGEKLRDAKEAAKQFIDKMNLAKDQVGVVSFADQATLDQPLSGNPAAAKAAIDSLNAGNLTAIGEAIKTAQKELVGPNHKTSNIAIMVLLSDGQNTAGEEPRTPASAAKSAGTRIITIGLGSGVDETALAGMASSDTDYHFAPTSSALTDIYNSIAQSFRALVTTNAILLDVVPGYATYIDGSATIPPQVSNKNLTWNIGILNANQIWTVSWRQNITIAGLVDSPDSRLNFKDTAQRLRSITLPQISISACNPANPTAVPAATTPTTVPAAAAAAEVQEAAPAPAGPQAN